MKKEEIVKKSALIGIGLAALAKERTEKIVKVLVKKGHLNTTEGKRLVKKIYTETEKSGKKVARVIETELKKVVKTVKTPTKKPVKKKAPKRKKKK